MFNQRLWISASRGRGCAPAMQAMGKVDFFAQVGVPTAITRPPRWRQLELAAAGFLAKKPGFENAGFPGDSWSGENVLPMGGRRLTQV